MDNFKQQEADLKQQLINKVHTRTGATGKPAVAKAKAKASGKAKAKATTVDESS